MSSVTVDRHPSSRTTADTHRPGDSTAPPAAATRIGFLATQVRRATLQRLQGLRGGQVHLSDPLGSHTLGTPSDDGLTAQLTVHNPALYRQLVFTGTLGAADSYLDGDWDCDDLVALFRIFCRNFDLLDGVDSPATTLARAALRAGHWLRRNSRHGSRRNIAAHYDLGNDFFELFLDPTMMYSSALFESPGQTLEQAQLARLNRICRKLELRPSDHLLEIGTGWGGLAIHAARHYGCRVTTTTISPRQHEYARARIDEAGLSGRITLLDQDYRDLAGTYDKLVSIEMIEAVGHAYFDAYFAQCARLLAPGGRLLLQAIVMPEQRYASYLRSVDFIQKHVFPGGCLPSISAMQAAVARTSNLRLLSLDDFAAGYARTLHEWRSRFLAQLDRVRELGYPERFLRLWDYYLSYCEAAFEERKVGVVQAMWGP
jgi:cyclopropane-fatty-acyl-phospholipid synthase